MLSSHVHGRAGRARALLLGAAFLLITTVALGVMAVAASAHHADVVASVHCEPLRVEYTATAWTGPDDASRTNPNIGVWYSVDGGATFVKLPDSPSHAFNPGNGFAFSDSFALSDPPPATVIVRVRAQANWADGNGPGQPRETSAIPVPPCPDNTTTTSPTTTSPTTSAPTTTPVTAAGGSTVTIAGGGSPSTGVGAASAAVGSAANATDTLPATGNSPVWLAALAVAALLAGLALLGRARSHRAHG
jgi:LPXTG-motif cell wall-anchored protein